MNLVPAYNGAFTLAQARFAAGLLDSALTTELTRRGVSEEDRGDFGASFSLSDGNKIMRLYVKRLNMTVLAASFHDDEPPAVPAIDNLARDAVGLVA